VSIITLTAVALLFTVGTYLVLQRTLSRVIIGLGVMSHGANLLIMLSAGVPAQPPVLPAAESAPIADPLPQAMVLTAIVITFGITAFLLALALRSYLLTGNDEVEDDIEDRRVARLQHATAEPEADDEMHEVAL
jgi:multicomponent Na+:H+ antiporter subunit C